MRVNKNELILLEDLNLLTCGVSVREEDNSTTHLNVFSKDYRVIVGKGDLDSWVKKVSTIMEDKAISYPDRCFLFVLSRYVSDIKEAIKC